MRLSGLCPGLSICLQHLQIDANRGDAQVTWGGGSQSITLTSIEHLIGSSYNDILAGDVIDLSGFSGISSTNDLDIDSFGKNVRIELSGTDYLTTIILTDFNSANLDNSDFMF